MILLPALLAAFALPAAAIRVPAHEDPAAVFERSRREPGVLHALIVSASWCGPCKKLKEQLAGYAPSTGPVAAAAWALTETDRLPDRALSKLLSEKGGWDGFSLPTVLVLRGGKPLGYSTGGANLGSIERFLADAAVRADGVRVERPRLACPGARDWATFTLGVSGYMSEENRSTDWFGREVLLAFRGDPVGPPARLFAPARSSSSTLASAPSGDGVFYAVDTTVPYDHLYGPIEDSTGAVAGLAQAPGNRVRLILTGHSGTSGMSVGYVPDPGYDESLGYRRDIRLEESHLSRGLGAARRAGKEVRGLVTACYGGQFAPAFMPIPGAAPACAAFAAIPERTAEGCYRSAITIRHDYVATLARGLTCPAPPGGSRARHYRAVAESESRDVPMLSSEYFLLYGPGADFLGRSPRQPAPPGGLLLKKYDDGLDLVFDLVGGGVVAARLNGKSIPLPRLSVLGCREGAPSVVGLPNLFYLRARGSGADLQKHSSCSTEVAVEWDRDDEGEAPPRRSLLLALQYDGHGRSELYNPANDWGDQLLEDLKEAIGPMTVDARGLKPESRVWLAVGWPRFARPLSGGALAKVLEGLAAEVRPVDSDLAGALVALTLRARADARKRGAKRDAEIAHWRVSRSSAGAPVDGPAEPSELGFSSEDLAQAMAENLGAKVYLEGDIILARLAHLATAAAAELSLREQAKTSKKARALAAQLAALKLCERTVLD